MAALVAATQGAELPVALSSEWPDSDDGPEVRAGEAVYALGPLLCRADGSVDAAVRMILDDRESGR